MNELNNKRINVRGVYFDNVDLNEATAIAEEFLRDESSIPKVIHTPNSEIVQLCIEKNEYYDIINSADLIIPDGIGVIKAAKILGRPLQKGKVAGVELFERIVDMSQKSGARLYFLGGKPGVAEIAVEKLKEKYPGISMAGVRDGYFKDENIDEIISAINESGADALFVCLGVPKQECFMRENRDKLNVKLMGGFGGSLDVFAGNVKRAPKIFINLGLEWFYRLMKEPKRIGRMMKLPKFLLLTIFYKISGKDKTNN